MKSIVPLLAAACAAALFGAAAASGQQPAFSAQEALVQARRVSFLFRTGRYELAPQSVAALEAAVKAAPSDARLWNALGTAYFQQVTASANAGAFKEIPALIGKARDAHARALALEPDNPEALSGHGTALAMAGGFARDASLIRRGVEQMDRAAANGPTHTLVRLQRGFGNLNLPREARNAVGAEEDLAYLVAMVDGGQAGDVLHLLLGDLQAETGRPHLAKAHYEAAARAGSTQQAAGAARLKSLAEGGVPAAEIARLRGNLGRDCAMCHGR